MNKYLQDIIDMLFVIAASRGHSVIVKNLRQHQRTASIRPVMRAIEYAIENDDTRMLDFILNMESINRGEISKGYRNIVLSKISQNVLNVLLNHKIG